MSWKVLLWISMLINVVGGLLNALMPTMSAPFGLTLDKDGFELLRFVGILQLGFATLSWAGLKVTSADARRVVDLALFVGYLLGIPYIIYEAATHQGGVVAYLLAVPAVILTIAFGYSLFGRRTEAGQQQVNSSRASGQ